MECGFGTQQVHYSHEMKRSMILIPVYRLFVLGGSNVPNVNMDISDGYVTYRKKFAANPQKGKSIASFFGGQNTLPYGLLLLYKNPGTYLQRHQLKQPNRNELKLTAHKPFIRIDQQWVNLLQAHLVDLVVYGVDTPNSQCKIFDELYPNFVLPIRRRYILRDVNPKGQLDYSCNRCTDRHQGFLPEVFRQGPVTPGRENNCQGDLLVLEAEETLRLLEDDEAKRTDYSEELPTVGGDMAACVPDSPLAGKRISSASKEDIEEVAFKKARSSDTFCSSQEKEFAATGKQMEEDKRQNIRKAIVYGEDETKEQSNILYWTSGRHYQRAWNRLMSTYQSDKLPVEYISNYHQNWFELVVNEANKALSTFRCFVCSRWYDTLVGRPNHKPLVAHPDGVLHETQDKNRKAILEHSKGVHNEVLQKLQLRLSEKNLPMSMVALQARQNVASNRKFEITAKMFRSVYLETKLNIPLDSHQAIVTMQRLNGVDMGQLHYERRSATRMLEFISKQYHEALTYSLKGVQSYNPTAIILDGASDAASNHYLVVLLQLCEFNRPTIYFYRLLPVSSDETADGLLGLLTAAFVVVGLADFFKHNLAAYGSDGAAVMQGKNNGLGKKIEEYVGRTIVSVHCLAHRIHLAVRRAFKKFTMMFQLESFINGLYTFYYRGHKRKSQLMEFAAEKFWELSYIFEVRWVSSELSAVRKVIDNYDALVGDLQAQSAMRTAAGAQAKGFLRTLKDKDFVEMLHFLADILNHIARYSLEMQRSAGVLIVQAGDNINNEKLA